MATQSQSKPAHTHVHIATLFGEQTIPQDNTLDMGRRTFVKLAGAGVAGLVLGVHVPNARAAVAAQTINAFVWIAPDNTITIFAKNPDMGQGTKTSLPLIVAEELDADWKHVVVEQAPINPKVYGRQSSGGSMSVTTSWDVLRQAGAAGKAMLIATAAKKWGVSPSEITARDSVLTHAASGRHATYGSLATAAAKMPVPDPKSLKLKTRSEFRLLGKRYTGVDVPKIVTGQPLYGIDVQRPGMVYANYTKCPAVGGKVKSANLDEIKALPGVLDAFVLGSAGDLRGQDSNFKSLMPGVAIIAKDTWTAFQAKQKLKIVWDESHASKDSTSHFSAQAKKIAAGPLPKTYDDNIGDVDKAFAQAAKTVEAYYEYPFLAHATLEPMNATAHFHDGVMEMWVPTQNPDSGLKVVSTVTNLPQDKVVFHQTRVGGGFGRRLMVDYAAEAAAIALKVKGPVKLQWMREDDFQHDFHRAGGFHQYKGAIDKNGKLDAWQLHLITFSRDNGKVALAANLSENLKITTVAPNLRRATSMMPLMIPTGFWRAPGDCAQVFAQQSFMHELSIAAGRDHKEFLLEAINRNVPELDTVRKGTNFSVKRASDVIKLCAEKAGWGKKLPKGSGMGLAWCYSHQGHVAQIAEISVDADKRIKIHRITVAVDIGPIVDMSGAESQGQGATINALSAAMGLQLSIENGRIQQTNYNAYPLLRIPFAPRTVDVHFLQSDNKPTGMGEPALPAMAATLGNAIFAATGVRVRSMPFKNLGYSFIA